VKELREKLLAALESTQTVNRRLVLFVFLFVVVVAAILISLNSAKPYQSDSGAALSSADQAPLEDQALEGENSLSLQQPTLFVHVVGEVVNPGIYMVESNSRLFDAIFAAGGFTKLADQSSVNLAREVSDGEQVIVMPIDAATAQASGSAPTSGRVEPLVSINRASQVELESLPGVGPTLAGRMVDWRTANGGFKRKEDLLKVTGIGQKLFASMKDKLSL
jgi:competence protein ComEA